MAEPLILHPMLTASARRRPDHVAVVEPDAGQITYRALDELTDRLRDRLAKMGVRRGDRVGVYLTKSIDSVASLFGAMKAGAAYVPVDPTAPPSRNAYIFNNCQVRAIVVEDRLAGPLADELAKLGPVPPMIRLDGVGAGRPLDGALAALQRTDPAPAVPTASPDPDDLGYILYTSGSTGKPKGVMLSHRNATCFVNWCSDIVEPRDDDRFSSHAPFHFDLSIFDLYVPLKHGATLVLVGHEVGKEPLALAELIEKTGITVWYSAPSILSMLAQFGKLEQRDYSRLRMIHFAGEVFPIKHLRLLKQLVPHPRYFNLYGPTETNVCTWFELPPDIEPDRTDPYPIGKVCAHYRSRVIDEHGNELTRGEEGELCIAGPGVMHGYWALDELTAKVFLTAPDGTRWYRTGDLVVEDDQGDFIFHGRRDRMVKKRGYRVELGEIEACLYQHEEVAQAAVIAVPDEDGGVRVKAFVSANNGKKLSTIRLKQFCSQKLPVYMVPDLFSFHDRLPTTSTDKVDYQALKAMQ